MKLTGRSLIPLFLILILALALPHATMASTTLGLAPTAYNLNDDELSVIAVLKSRMAKKAGQTVSVRNLNNEKELLDWLMRYRVLDVALITLSHFNKQPAGSLLQLANIYLEREKGPSLVMVSTPGLNPELRKEWEAALLDLKPDNPPATETTERTKGNSVKSGEITSPAIAQKQNEVLSPAPQIENKPLPAENSHKTIEPPLPAAPVSEPEPPVIQSAPSEMKPLPVVENSANDFQANDRLIPENAALADFIKMVIDYNQRIKGERLKHEIARTEEEKTYAIFEPDFITSLQLEDNRLRNTAEESLNRLLSSIYEERNWDYNASLQGLLPTGTHYNLGYKYRNLSNTVTDDLYGEDAENQMYLGLSLTQPLLKNAGVDATKAEIKIAGHETQASLHDYRQELMKTAKEAALAYWDYYQAQEMLKLREESVRIASTILDDNRERQRTGKMAKTEVLEAMAGVANRESLVSEARYEKQRAENHIRALLAIAPGHEALPVKPGKYTLRDIPEQGRDDRIKKATTLRPDYLAAYERVKQADTKIAFAKNQSWPELDVFASYGLNGLAFSSGDAWDQIADTEYESWAIGLELTLPLLGGIDTKSDLKKSQLEKKAQLWELKDIEINLANEIDSALSQMVSSSSQLTHAEDIVELNLELLTSEKTKLESGKSSSRLVLEKEEQYRTARETKLEKQVSLQSALIDLELAEGSILVNNGVEIMGRQE